MNGYPSEQLMTIEEALRLSDPHTSRDANEQRRKIWAWQSVAGAMAQAISDEQIERMEKLALRKYK